MLQKTGEFETNGGCSGFAIGLDSGAVAEVVESGGAGGLEPMETMAEGWGSLEQSWRRRRFRLPALGPWAQAELEKKSVGCSAGVPSLRSGQALTGDFRR